MAKRILTLCLALVIGIAFAMPATAAVKSIKVGGDLTIRGIYRQNLDFQKTLDPTYQTWENRYLPTAESWLMSTTRIWVNADLTDNVSAVVRLLNERDWSTGDSYGDNSQAEIDLAYIQMKDLFIPGFSATLGRQEILLGKGFVVGNRSWLGPVTTDNSIRAKDLTSRKSFDAVRADYEVGTIPLTVTLFDAKITETAPDNADGDLSGINVGYKTDNLNVEGYALLLDQQTDEFNHLYTFGARIDHNVFPGLNYNLEAAIQQGKSAGNKIPRGSMEGWAGNADVSYTFQSPMQLKLGAAWFYASGDMDNNGNQLQGSWVPLYPDNLGDRIGRITYASMVNNSPFGTYVTPGSNMSVPKAYASFKPSEKSTVALAWFPDTTFVSVPSGVSKVMDWEADLGYTYQYTEDVSFGLGVDYAVAGKAIKQFVNDQERGIFNSDAWEVIGTVAVAF